jgi:tRNA dimethylallyltransferase
MSSVDYYPLPTTNYKLIVVVGETASGKSALALELAKRYNGELICADAMTVYPGFDIGTAKPSAEEQAMVPHHLLDIADPKMGFNAPLFKIASQVKIVEISARGNLPILVGGTGLYIDSILYDYGFLEASEPAERAKLDSMSLAALLELATQRNLPLETVDARNKRRVIRLIENAGATPTRQALRPNTIIVGLAPDRAELDKRITQRVDAMLAEGLAAEVRGLAEQYGWDVEPMKAIGYREWLEYFEGKQSLEITRERIIAGTRRLAKKQRTWFRRNPDIVWFNNQNEAYEYLQKTMVFKQQ